MKHRILIGTTPWNEQSLGEVAGRDYSEMECYALQGMLERRLGSPPAGAEFECIEMTIRTLSSKPERSMTTISLAISYQLNDPEAAAYVSEIDAVLEELREWDDEAEDELGDEYFNNHQLHGLQRRPFTIRQAISLPAQRP